MARKCSVALKIGSPLTARRYGVHLTSDDGGTLLVQDSAIRTETSSIVVKDSNFENFLASRRWFPPSKNISIIIERLSLRRDGDVFQQWAECILQILRRQLVHCVQQYRG